MKLLPYNQEGYQLLHDGSLCFSLMEQNGIRMDVAHLKHEYKNIGKEIQEKENEINVLKEIKIWKEKYKSKFNLDSDAQLADILFNELKHEAIKLTDTGNPSVDQEALKALNSPFANLILRYRKLFKIRNTYLKGLIKETYNEYLHPSINVHTTRTYRSSANSPNIQNQPTRDPEAGEVIRKAFIPREGNYLVCADYGGIEVKMACVMHQDPTMLKYLRNPTTADMHSDFACLLFKMDDIDQSIKGEKTLRAGTKNSFTFPQFYGDYYGNNAIGLWKWMGLTSKKINPKEGVKIRDDITIAQHLINNGIRNYKQFENNVKLIEEDMWKRRFPVYKQWRENQYKTYLKKGFVTTLSGFVCQGLMDKNATINYPIQGLAFHCLLWSCIQLTNKILKQRKMKTKLIFQVHDEIVADVPQEEYDDYLELLKETMVHDLLKHWSFINMPLELEVDRSELNGNWFETETVLHYIH